MYKYFCAVRYWGMNGRFLLGNEKQHMLISPQVFFCFFFMNSIKFFQYCLSLVSMLMLMDHLSSSRSLISSPYRLHHFIWPKGNNKSLIHYPLTEAAMRKYLIRGNKLNFNHLEDAQHIKQNTQMRLYHWSHAIYVHFFPPPTKFNTIDNQIISFAYFLTNKDQW